MKTKKMSQSSNLAIICGVRDFRADSSPPSIFIAAVQIAVLGQIQFTATCPLNSAAIPSAHSDMLYFAIE